MRSIAGQPNNLDWRFSIVSGEMMFIVILYIYSEIPRYTCDMRTPL